MISKSYGLIQADYIVENVIFKIGNRFGGFVDAFNNCREQGYVLCVYAINEMGIMSLRNCLSIYIYNNRHSDNPSITWDYEFAQKLYSEDAYYNRTLVFDTVDGAVDKIIELILEFENETEEEELESEV